MLNIDDPADIDNTPAIWRLGFRPFFLGGAVVAALYIPLWLMGWFTPQYSLFNGEFWANVLPLWWHPHEMLFGFAMAIVCGFLLTAAQAWTNQPTMKGRLLALTFGCWLGARLLLLLPFNIPLWLPALFDSLFLGISAATLWRCIYTARQWRNIGFPIMLVVALVVNLVSYYALYERNFSLSTQLWQAMIWWLAMVITIVGGRVIPFFTAMKLQHPKPNPIQALEITLLLVMGLLFVQSVLHLFPREIEQGFLLSAGILQLVRVSRWKGHKTFKEPMLWSLHVSYWALPITLLAMAWQINNEFAYRTLLHLFAVGGIASLCLSMISRVSLGHTSRNIYQGPNMVIAFIGLPLAAIFRAVMPLWIPQYTSTWLWLAGACWFISFGMFVWHYAPILTKPRLDGRPG
jgi:uncharacterized protein involved in response to NO